MRLHCSRIYTVLGAIMQIVLNKELTLILQLLAAGKTNREISETLNYSLRSVERKIKTLKDLYKVDNRIMLAQEYLAERLGNL